MTWWPQLSKQAANNCCRLLPFRPPIDAYSQIDLHCKLEVYLFAAIVCTQSVIAWLVIQTLHRFACKWRPDQPTGHPTAHALGMSAARWECLANDEVASLENDQAFVDSTMSSNFKFVSKWCFCCWASNAQTASKRQRTCSRSKAARVVAIASVSCLWLLWLH